MVENDLSLVKYKFVDLKVLVNFKQYKFKENYVWIV